MRASIGMAIGRARASLVIAALLALGGCQSLSVPGFGGDAEPREIPAATRAQFETALAAQREGNWSEAERLHAQLLEENPRLSGPALNLALIYAQTQRPQQADEYFQRALKINPDNPVAGVQYGVWLREQGRLAEAETVYLQTIARDADCADAHLNLAILYDIYLGRLPEALEHYQRYAALKGDEQGPVPGWITDLQRRLQKGG